MSATREFSAILRMNVAGLTQRLGQTLTIVIGITCAVGVLVSMLTMSVGASGQTMSDVRADRVIVTGAGAQSTLQSNIPKDMAYAVRDMPGIRKSATGEPAALFEAMVLVEGRKKVDDARVNFPLIGVSTGLDEVRPELRLTAGRMFKPGLNEIIANDICAQQYTGFEVGDTRPIRGNDWKIVGQFSRGHAGGTCTLYADVDSIWSAFGRDTYNDVTVLLPSPDGFKAFQAALQADPKIHVEAKRESSVVAEENKQLTTVLNFASYFVGAIMAIGATLGAANSLYAIVDSRRRELATLRAIGFRSGPIMASIVTESILLAVPGALLGAALAWIFFNGVSVNPRGVSFQLAVTPALVGVGVAWALIMGIVGGFPPALRAVRVPITTGLRAT